MVDYSSSLEYARNRKVVLPDEFYTMDLHARSNAATISRLASLEQIKTVLNLVTKSIESGGTFNDFKKQVEEQGIELSDHHLANVYRTNIQNAYAYGRWLEQEGNKESRPYLRYSAIIDSRTRPTHLALNDIIRHIDDEFWNKHYPPNGFQCRCTVESLTEKMADRIGITPDDQLVDLPQNKYDWDYHPFKQNTYLNEVIDQKLDDPFINHTEAQELLKIKDDAIIDQSANKSVIDALKPLDASNKKILDEAISKLDVSPSDARITFEFAQDEESLSDLAKEALIRKTHDKKSNSIWNKISKAFDSILSKAKNLKDKLTGNSIKGFDSFNLQKGNVIGIQTPTLFKTAESAGKSITILDMKGHAIDLSKIQGLDGALLAPDLNLQVVDVTSESIILKRTEEKATRLFIARNTIYSV